MNHSILIAYYRNKLNLRKQIFYIVVIIINNKIIANCVESNFILRNFYLECKN